MNQEIVDLIKELIENEYYSACAIYPDFRSAHEGYAVLKEELEETEDEMNILKENMDELWEQIKGNHTCLYSSTLKDLEDHSLSMIKEAVQVAAMVYKYHDLIRKESW